MRLLGKCPVLILELIPYFFLKSEASPIEIYLTVCYLTSISQSFLGIPIVDDRREVVCAIVSLWWPHCD